MLLVGDERKTPKDDERRRTPRIQLLDTLEGRLLPIDTLVTVVDVGLGGFSIESPLAFTVGAVHEFRLFLPSGGHLQVRARVAHCRQDVGGAHADVYVAGFAFADDLPGERAGATLVDSITSSLTFE